MDWDEVREAGSAIGFITYVGTRSADGEPHVAPASPGFGDEGVVWFATRASSKKARNLRADPRIAFHWPVATGSGPGELVARGAATIHEGEEARHALWEASVVPFDLSNFFGSPDNPDLVFVETKLDRARLMGPDFVPRVWERST